MANRISGNKDSATYFKNEKDVEELRYMKADGRFRFILAVFTAFRYYCLG